MTQHDIAGCLLEMADLLEFRGDNPFRIRAYRRAARTLEGFANNLESLAAAGRLDELPGVGIDISRKIEEYLATGQIKALEQLKRGMPRGLCDLLAVPSLGPKTVRVLYEKLTITSVSKLEAAARAGTLRRLPGFGAKKEANILKGIELVKKGRERLHLGLAWPLVEQITALLKKVRGVTQVSTAGSVRRMQETVGDLDILVASRQPAKVMQAFTGSSWAARTLAAGSTKSSILTPEGVQVDLRVVEPKSFGAALQYFTGSKEHNVRVRELAVRKGLKVNEYGVFQTKTHRRVAGRTEAEVYRSLGLRWIPPELREDRGELDAAKTGRLPHLVELDDLRGDFHVHTNWSDGHDPLDRVVRAGQGRGYAYLGISDHSQSLKVAHGMSVSRIHEQMETIRGLNTQTKRFQVLMGSEVDILSNGSLDYPTSVLKGLDFVIASIHTGFGQGEAVLTRRVITAMHNPYVTIIAHPTGRLMGQRDAYPLDFGAIVKAAKETGTALEINASPRRLDLNDAMARQARDAGVMLAISTDAHTIDQLDQMVYGIGVARRAWIEPKQVLNCLSLVQLMAWIARKRQRV